MPNGVGRSLETVGILAGHFQGAIHTTNGHVTGKFSMGKRVHHLKPASCAHQNSNLKIEWRLTCACAV